jgi:hypothetical protein
MARNMARRVEERGMAVVDLEGGLDVGVAGGGEVELAVVEVGETAGVAFVAVRTSSLTIRPSLPVPLTCERSTPFSRASRRVAGVAKTSTFEV